MAAPRNRVIYSALGLYTGPTPATGYNFSSGNSGINLISQLERVQTSNYSLTINRANVNQFGQIDTVSREIIEGPQVNLDAQWIVSDVTNENKIGINTNSGLSAISTIVNGVTDEKNYYLAIAADGTDLIGDAVTNTIQVKQFTNMVLASYAAEGAVGGLPTVSASWVGLNYGTFTGSSNQVSGPIDRSTSTQTSNTLFTLPLATTGVAGVVAAIRPADITLSAITGFNYVATDLHPQRYNISFSMNRQNLNQLGSFYSYAQPIQFPVTLTASFDFYYGNITPGSLSTILCNDAPYTIVVTLKDPSCPTPGQGAVAAQYTMVGLKLDSQSESNNIGNVANTTTLSYSVQLSNSASSNGLYISGQN